MRTSIDFEEWTYSTSGERLRLLWTHEVWPIVRWGIWPLVAATLLRIGYEAGVRA